MGSSTYDVELEQIQTATIRQKGRPNGSWSPLISATKAIKAAGLEDNEQLYFAPEHTQQGLSPILSENADNRIERTILVVGGGTLRVLLPDEVLDALSITREEIDSDDPPEVAIYAGTDDDGNGVLALERAGQKTITIPTDE